MNIAVNEDSNCYSQHHNHDSNYIPCSRKPLLLLLHKAICIMLINR